MATDVRFSLVPGEVLLEPRDLWVRSPVPLDKRSVLDGIVVEALDARCSVPGRLRVEDSGRAVSWRAVRPLEEGRYLLTASNLRAANGGEVVVASRGLRFSVRRTKTRLPAEVAAIHVSRLRLTREGLRPLHRCDRASRWFEVVKTTHRESGRVAVAVFDQGGDREDWRRLTAKVANMRRARWGRVHPDLRREMKRASPDEPIRAALWLRVRDLPEVPDEVRDDPRAETPGAAIERQVALAERLRELREEIGALTGPAVSAPPLLDATVSPLSLSVDATLEHNPDAALDPLAGQDLDDDNPLRPDHVAPVLHGELTANQISRALKHPDIAMAYLVPRTSLLDVDQAMGTANASAAHATGADGAGIRVAVWEGYRPANTTDLDIEETKNPAGPSSKHTSLVCAVVKHEVGGRDSGFAPQCTLRVANDGSSDGLAWAATTERCSVINQSFHHVGEADSGEFSFYDQYCDWVALSWPWPTIVQAAGNTGEVGVVIAPPTAEYVNHKGYNTLRVGSHLESGTSMAGTSVFTNPPSPGGDRELPELAATGTSISALGLTASGTSFAAPAVAGAAAAIQSVHPDLVRRPEACRAVLLAGSKTRLGVAPSWWDDVSAGVDRRQGVGRLDVREAAEIAGTRRGPTPDARPLPPGVPRAWGWGRLRGDQFSGAGTTSRFRYRITTPRGGFSRVRVVLTWHGRVDDPEVDLANPSPGPDLDLVVLDESGIEVGSSRSLDNSYEVVDFYGAGGASYQARLVLTSGTPDVAYGIAWSATLL